MVEIDSCQTFEILLMSFYQGKRVMFQPTLPDILQQVTLVVCGIIIQKWVIRVGREGYRIRLKFSLIGIEAYSILPTIN